MGVPTARPVEGKKLSCCCCWEKGVRMDAVGNLMRPRAECTLSVSSAARRPHAMPRAGMVIGKVGSYCQRARLSLL